jgi:hypothetical protein
MPATAGCEMTARSNELEVVEAEARYYRDRVALLRARLYSRGMGWTPRLQELERQLQRAEQRLADVRAHQTS